MRPKIIKLDEKQSFSSAISKAARVIKNGGIVVHPTDTCYGIAADITNEQAIRNVYSFKKRENTLFNMIVKDFDQWKQYGKLHSVIKKIIRKYADCQFSFVVPRTKKAPAFFRPGIPTLSIQIPKLKFSRMLLEKTGAPLVATSANLTGAEVCYEIKDLLNQYPEGMRFDFEVLILDSGRLSGRKPSTVVEIINNHKFKILRKGDVERIEIP